MSKLYSRGFTIVELLIVIVVIAILASISVVAYNGIQTRSNNTQTVSAVKEYAKMLIAYKVDTGGWPAVSGNRCIGVSPCGLMSGDGTSVPCDMGQGQPVSSAALEDMLKSSLGAPIIPLTSNQEVSCGNGNYRGAWYWTDGVATRRITYYLKGDQPCQQFASSTGIHRVQNGDATRCATFFNGN